MSNIEIYKQILLIILLILIIFYLLKTTKFIYSKTFCINYFNKLKNKNKITSNFITHQEIYKNLTEHDKQNFIIYLIFMRVLNLVKIIKFHINIF